MQKEIEYQEALVEDVKRLCRARKKYKSALNEWSKPRELVANLELDQALQEAKQNYNEVRESLGAERLAECERYMATNKRRWMRVRAGVRRLLQNDAALFVTLTFTDDCLASTSAKTRREYVRDYLKSQTDDYMANIDFGKKNSREHYHALVRACSIDLTPWREAHGSINVKRVKVASQLDAEGFQKSVGRLSHYIDKLTNHALKGVTDNRIIWSRKRPSEVELLDVTDDDDFLSWLDDLA